MLIKLCILFGSLFSFKIYTISLAHRHLPQRGLACADVYVVGESCTWCNSLSLELLLLSTINSLLRSIRCFGKNWQGCTSSPTSDVSVRSFLYLSYTLIKLCYTKALSGQALSLAPDRNPLLLRPRIPTSFTAHSPNHLGGSSRIPRQGVSFHLSPANLDNSAGTKGLEKVSLHSNPKERQCQKLFKLLYNCT